MQKLENSYQSLPEKLFSKVTPAKVTKPVLLLLNRALTDELGISKSKENLTQILSGNKVWEASQPIAQAYAGHQFGHFNVLGDGRAILLGEHQKSDGNLVDIQLKGAGQTPYSRRGDGRATLYSMLREFLLSEAMFALNIPTNRALSVIGTGEQVHRETVQHGAVLTRVASSHIRVGTFEYARRFLDTTEQNELLDYTINRHYPEVANSENPALALLEKVAENQVKTITHWLRVGFIHGVMNTDNMSISGETFDYGPCAFMNNYNPETVYSSIDTGSRYAFGNQDNIAIWNLYRFAESLLPLIHENSEKAIEKATTVLEKLTSQFEESKLKMFANKMGFEFNDDANDKLDRKIIGGFLKWMRVQKLDYTLSFLKLEKHLQDDSFTNEFNETVWFDGWKERVQNKQEAIALMQKNNPTVIPRNSKVEEALKSAAHQNNWDGFNELLTEVQDPYVRSDSSFKSNESHSDGVNYRTFCGT